MAFVLGPEGRFPTTPRKWALFDLDWTLIRPTTTPQRSTLAGGPLSFWPNDWALLPGRVERLKDFLREGHTIGVITNQKFTGHRLQNAVARVQAARNLLVEALGTDEIYFMVSTDESTAAIPGDPATLYRKPGKGWAYHLQFLPGTGLYVGDAVQDPTRPDRGWGYSDIDRQFAANMGLPFFSPEEVFPQLPLPPELFQIPKLVLILVGPPGSGKSSFARQLVSFTHVESDAYKSNWSRIQRAFREALARNERVVIDATNPSRQRRLEIIRMAREHQAPVGIVLFLNTGKWSHAPGRAPTHQMAYNRFWANFEEPNPQLEGTPVYYQL